MNDANRFGVKFVALLEIGNLSGFADQIVEFLVTVTRIIEDSFWPLLRFVTAKSKGVRVAGIDDRLGAAQDHLELPVASNVHIAGRLEIIDFGLDARGRKLLLEDLVFFFL